MMFEPPPTILIPAVGSSIARMPFPVPVIVLLATMTFDVLSNAMPNTLPVTIKFTTVTFDVNTKLALVVG